MPDPAWHASMATLSQLRDRVVQDTVRPHQTVVLAPGLNAVAGSMQGREPMIVKAFIPEPPIEALDVGILRRHARLSKSQFYAVLGCPGVQCQAGKFRPEIEVSASIATLSLVKSSTILRQRIRHLSANRSVIPMCARFHRTHLVRITHDAKVIPTTKLKETCHSRGTTIGHFISPC